MVKTTTTVTTTTTATLKYSRKNHQHCLPNGELNIEILKHFSPSSSSSTATSSSSTQQPQQQTTTTNDDTTTTPSMKDMITATARCLQESYPSYRHLTIGDIIFGLGCVAKEHARQDLISQSLGFPYEYERNKKHSNNVDQEQKEEEATDEEYKWWNEHCLVDYSIPIPIDDPEQLKERNNEELQEKLLFAKQMVYYANLAYSNIADESERELIEKTIFEEYERKNSWFSGKSKYTKEVLRYLESIRFEKNIQYYVNKNVTHQQAFFVKLNHETKSVIIALRGTSSLEDIFTNLTAENSTLKVHRYYGDYKRNQARRQHLIQTANLTNTTTTTTTTTGIASGGVGGDENYYESDMTEDMIEGKVHAGYINTARWVIGKIEDCLYSIFDSAAGSPYSNYRIICTGHSLGGGLASVVAILLRELFLKRFKAYHISMRENKNIYDSSSRLNSPEPPLPDIEAICYASSTVFSENLSNWCRSFVTTFVIGADVVPRIGIGQMERLRMEINQTNWEEKLAKFFEEHSKIANMATKLDGFLLDKGYTPIFQTKKTALISSASKGNLVTTTDSTSYGAAEDVETMKQQQQQFSMNSSSPPLPPPHQTSGLEEEQHQINTLLSEMNEMNTNIITLYPPGTIYLIIPDLEQMNSKDRKKKDLSEALFTVFNDKIFADDEEGEAPINTTTGQSLSTLPPPPTPSTETTQPKEEKSLFSSFVSTVKTVYNTVVENIKEEEENPYLAKFELYDIRSFSQPKNTTVPTDLKFHMKRVEVKQFERIILSRFIFSHHTLIGYKHAFDSLINMTQLNL